MNIILLAMGITILSLLLLFIVHVLMCRFIVRKSLVVSFFMAMVLSFIILTGLHLAVWRYARYSTIEWGGIYLADFIIFFCLSYCYINFINIGNASVRIKALNEISMAENGVTIRDILDKYNSEIILNIRLERMLYNGQIVQRDNVFLSGKSRQILLALFFKFWRRIILGRK
jgi:hypothetical protein